jgi:hypothetical protein
MGGGAALGILGRGAGLRLGMEGRVSFREMCGGVLWRRLRLVEGIGTNPETVVSD